MNENDLVYFLLYKNKQMKREEERKRESFVIYTSSGSDALRSFQ